MIVAVRPVTGEELERVDAKLPLSRLDQPQTDYLVAWAGDEPIGHACLDWRNGTPELQDVFVQPELRRRGIAGELTTAAEQLVRERGFRRLRLTVGIGNTGARELYERAGYEPTGAPPRRVQGTIMLRGKPFEVDDTLVELAKDL